MNVGFFWIFFIWLASIEVAANDNDFNIKRFKEHIQVLQELIPSQNISTGELNDIDGLDSFSLRSLLNSLLWNKPIDSSINSLVELQTEASNGRRTITDMHPVLVETTMIASLSAPAEHSDYLTTTTMYDTSTQAHILPSPSQVTIHQTETSIVKVTETVTHYFLTTVSWTNALMTPTPSPSPTSSSPTDVNNVPVYTSIYSSASQSTIGSSSFQEDNIKVSSNIHETQSTSNLGSKIGTSFSTARKPSNVNAILNKKNSNSKLSINPQFKYHNQDYKPSIVQSYAKPKIPQIGGIWNKLKNMNHQFIGNREPSSELSLDKNIPLATETVKSVYEVALKVKPTKVQDIESANESILPSKTVTQGYLKTYPAFKTLADSMVSVQTFHIEDGDYVYDFIIEKDQPQSVPRHSSKTQFDILHVPPELQHSELKFTNGSEVSQLATGNGMNLMILNSSGDSNIEVGIGHALEYSNLQDETTQDLFAGIYKEDDFEFLKNGATGFMSSNTILVTLVAMIALWL